jgi:hypothetical protein
MQNLILIIIAVGVWAVAVQVRRLRAFIEGQRPD